MAYMSQEKKAGIAAELKKIMPKDWKWSLGVHHHSTIVLNIWSAPVDLLAIVNATRGSEYQKHFGDAYKPENYIQLNQYHLSKEFAGDEEISKLFGKISEALNRGNHDRSDTMTDYFDVGWYVDINLGKWDKPFQYIPKPEPKFIKHTDGVTLPELVKILWTRACAEDGIEPDSKFVVFSESNKFAKMYNEAMLLVSKAAQ